MINETHIDQLIRELCLTSAVERNARQNLNKLRDGVKEAEAILAQWTKSRQEVERDLLTALSEGQR